MFHGPVPPLRGSFPVNSLDRFNTHLLPVKIVSHNKPRDIQVIPFKKRFRWLDLGTISSKTFWFRSKMFTICLTAYLLFYLHHFSSVKIGRVIYPTEINIAICYKYYNDVSENSGTPKSSILIGFDYKPSILEVFSLFSETPIISRHM